MVFRIRKAIENGRRSAAFWMVVVVATVGIAVNLSSSRGWLPSSESWADENRGAAPSGAKSHFREGTELEDLQGNFRIVGDRLIFVETTTNPRTFRCLENLALQRVYQAIVDEDREKNWIAQGRITEYRNENFLLLERVVRAPQADPSVDRASR